MLAHFSYIHANFLGDPKQIPVVLCATRIEVVAHLMEVESQLGNVIFRVREARKWCSLPFVISGKEHRFEIVPACFVASLPATKDG